MATTTGESSSVFKSDDGAVQIPLSELRSFGGTQQDQTWREKSLPDSRGCFCCFCVTGTVASMSVDRFRVRWRLAAVSVVKIHMSSTQSGPAFDCTSHTYLRAYFNRQIHRSRLLVCAMFSLHPFVSVFCVLFFVSRLWCLLSNYHSRVMISLAEAPAL